MRPFDTFLRKSSFDAGSRLGLGALVFFAIGCTDLAVAAENYRGHDPDSYECSSDYNILNRFSAPPGAPSYSTKYADIKFTLVNDVISVKDASNSKDLAFIVIGENAKYCVRKGVRTIPKSKEPDSDRPECNVRYYAFEMRIVIDSELPVRPFSLRAPVMFDRMNHLTDISIYRAADSRKTDSAAGCNQPTGVPDVPYFRFLSLSLSTDKKSDVIVTEEAPYKLREGEVYSGYERRALKKAGPGFSRPK